MYIEVTILWLLVEMVAIGMDCYCSLFGVQKVAIAHYFGGKEIQDKSIVVSS